MGSWDQLCIICGISPSAGPLRSLLSRYDLDKATHDITEEILSATVESKQNDEMPNIVREGLSSTFSENERKLGYIPEWKPAGVSDWFAFRRCVAIGHFDGQFGTATILKDKKDGSVKIPSGRNVEVRLVDNFGSAWFDHRLMGLAEDADGEILEMEREEVSGILDSNGNPNFFTSEGCYHYLRAWLDLDGMPPRSRAFPMESTPLTFGGELYEVINSRYAVRDQFLGTLNSIDYDGITATCVQWQDHFYPARKGVKNITLAIQNGLRGKQLIPAILHDCRAWMFMRPDIWPTPSDFTYYPRSTSYQLNKSSSVTPFCGLPYELLLQIHYELPFLSCISLWSTCKSLRTLLSDSNFVNRVLSEAIINGHLRWILPVESMPREVVRPDGELHWKLPFRGVPTEPERASAAIDQWYKDPVVGGMPSSNSPVPKLLIPGFPLLDFVCACFQSDSMRNRERIWNNVKQFETLWKAYRTDGWEVDRFYDP